MTRTQEAVAGAAAAAASATRKIRRRSKTDVLVARMLLLVAVVPMVLMMVRPPMKIHVMAWTTPPSSSSSSSSSSTTTPVTSRSCHHRHRHHHHRTHTQLPMAKKSSSRHQPQTRNNSSSSSSSSSASSRSAPPTNTKDAPPSTSSRSTSPSPSRNPNTIKTNSPPPPAAPAAAAAPTGSLKFEQKIQEIHQKDRQGEALTQSYCDSILGVCVAQDEWESVLEVLDIMKRHGFIQERSTYRACLQACLEAGNGASAKEILQAMDKAGVAPTPYDIGLTVAAMCRQKNDASTTSTYTTSVDGTTSPSTNTGWWRKALALLKSSATNPEIVVDNNHPDNVIPIQAYNVILECMVEERQWKEAVRLLRLMEDGCAAGTAAAAPSSPTTTRSISTTSTSTANTSTTTKTRPVGGYHPAPEVSTYREVIECCVATNQAEQAAQILYSMKGRGVKPTAYACELVISALSRKLQWRRALQLLELMDEMQVPKTVVTYNAVIGACARAREVGMAKSLLVKMQRTDGIRPDEVSFNSVIGACASTARWKDALSLLDQCYREPGVTPNIYIYTNAMRACAKGGNTKRALSLLQVVKDKGLPLDTYCYTAVIDACAKAKMWKKALALLDEMQDQGIEPSEVTYSVTISACGNGGQWQKALDLLQLMKTKGMSVNAITYNAALTALSKASRQKARYSTGKFSSEQDDDFDDHGDGLWSRALGILEEMKADGIEPDGFCYSSAISCCGAEGRWKEALELIDTMKKGGPRTRPNRISYTAAISACGRAGEAEHALTLFQSMKDEGLSADRVAYNALFAALRVAGDATKTFQLWGEICGTRSTVSTNKIATAKDIATPDIITVTDCISTLSRAEHLPELDQVFREAVERGIVLRSNGLDLQWETDLSGMSLPVARAAVRYILNQCIAMEIDDSHDLQDMTFITGVGRAQQRRREDGVTPPAIESKNDGSSDLKDLTTSLREYVQEVLQSDFQPGLHSTIPPRAQGTVEIPKDTLQEWISKMQAR